MPERDLRGSARLLLVAADRLAAELAALIASGRLDARSPAADALLDYDHPDNDSHRRQLGLGPRPSALR
jgi:hypothetical protein